MSPRTLHDAAVTGHLVAAERAERGGEPLGDHLVEDGLHTAESDDDTARHDGGATPLDVAHLVQVGHALLDETAGQAGLQGHLGLLEGDLEVLRVAVHDDVVHREEAVIAGIQHDERAVELVGRSVGGGRLDGGQDELPRGVAELVTQLWCGNVRVVGYIGHMHFLLDSSVVDSEIQASL